MKINYKSVLKSDWIVAAGLILLVFLLRLPSLEVPFDNDSGANAYHARLILRGEPLYSTHHPAHHMPAVYYIYSLAFMLLGDSTWSVKFILIPWLIATAYLIYRIGIRFDRMTGILGAVFFTVLTSHLWLKGLTAEIELFVNLPRAVVILLLLNLDQQKSGEWKYIFAGLLSGITFLFKAVYLDSLIISSVAILFGLLKNREQNGVWRSILLRYLWVGIGFVFAVLPVFFYFYANGLGSRFLMVFKLGSGYSSLFLLDVSLLLMSIAPLMILGINNFLLLAISFIGLINLSYSVRTKWLEGGPLWVASLLMVLWYVLSWLEAGISKFGFVHYGILVLPPLSIAAAWGLSVIHRGYRARKVTSSRFSPKTPSLYLLMGILVISILVNINFYYQYARFKFGYETNYEFLIAELPSGIGDNSIGKIVEFIRATTLPDEYIYLWSDRVEIYYYADRRAPVEVPWPLYAEAFGSYKRIFNPKTKFILEGESILIPKPDWLYEELDDNYVLEMVIEEYELYRRKY